MERGVKLFKNAWKTPFKLTFPSSALFSARIYFSCIQFSEMTARRKAEKRDFLLLFHFSKRTTPSTRLRIRVYWLVLPLSLSLSPSIFQSLFYGSALCSALLQWRPVGEKLRLGPFQNPTNENYIFSHQRWSFYDPLKNFRPSREHPTNKIPAQSLMKSDSPLSGKLGTNLLSLSCEMNESSKPRESFNVRPTAASLYQHRRQIKSRFINISSRQLKVNFNWFPFPAARIYNG